MIAPKAPGHTVRNEFATGGGIPDFNRRVPRCFWSNRQAKRYLTRWASAVVVQVSSKTTFKDETETDHLVSKRYCGGAVELVKWALKPLLKQVYAPRNGLLECLHIELKLIVDLMY